MRTKKTIILSAIVLIAIALFVGIKEYNRTAEELTFKKPDYTLESSQLQTQFSENEELANTKYLDKIIQVQGQVAQVEVQGDTLQTIYMEGNGLSGVACEVSTSIPFLKVKTGDDIVLKGICTGYLMDVVLVRCVPVQ